MRASFCLREGLMYLCCSTQHRAHSYTILVSTFDCSLHIRGVVGIHDCRRGAMESTVCHPASNAIVTTSLDCYMRLGRAVCGRVTATMPDWQSRGKTAALVASTSHCIVGVNHQGMGTTPAPHQWHWVSTGTVYACSCSFITSVTILIIAVTNTMQHKQHSQHK